MLFGGDFAPSRDVSIPLALPKVLKGLLKR